MHNLNKKVETIIRDTIPEKLAIIFDGCWSDDTHYVSVYATYPATNECGYEKGTTIVLLAFSQVEHDESLDSNEHI